MFVYSKTNVELADFTTTGSVFNVKLDHLKTNEIDEIYDLITIATNVILVVIFEF